MKLDDIMPEIYSFIEFTNHECRMAVRHDINKVTTHIGGEVPKVHPMPYNVYLPVSQFLKKNPKELDNLVNYLEQEFSKTKYDYKKVTIKKLSFTEKKGLLSKMNSLPYIEVSIDL